MDINGDVLFADGRRIRKVIRANGSVITVAGLHNINEWEPPTKCENLASKTALRWPTDLTINVLDQSLFFLDGDEVLQLKEGIIYRPQSCRKGSKLSLIESPKAITFSQYHNSLMIMASSLLSDRKPTLFKMDLSSDGQVEDLLKMPDEPGSWFSDMTTLSDGAILAW